MYIKNQTFKDEDILLEMLFDFSLGESSEPVSAIITAIGKEMLEDKELQDHLATLEEEDRLELDFDILYENLAKALLKQYDSFKVYNATLSGIKNGTETVLYKVDLH